MKNLTFLLLIIALFGCSANNNNITPNDTNSTKIDINNLDEADDGYIELKSADANKEVLKRRAIDLANAHIKNREFILANFYIQEALQLEPYNEELKFLLVKNQYLAALNNKNGQDYLIKAIKALEENVNLITDYNYLTQAQDMLKEVKGILAKSYLATSNFYKKEGKVEASEKYLQKSIEVDEQN